MSYKINRKVNRINIDSQEDFDNLPAFFDRKTLIYLTSKAKGIHVNRFIGGAQIKSIDGCPEVIVEGDAHVTFLASKYSRPNGIIKFLDSSTGTGTGGQVVVGGLAKVKVTDPYSLGLIDRASVELDIQRFRFGVNIPYQKEEVKMFGEIFITQKSSLKIMSAPYWGKSRMSWPRQPDAFDLITEITALDQSEILFGKKFRIGGNTIDVYAESQVKIAKHENVRRIPIEKCECGG